MEGWQLLGVIGVVASVPVVIALLVRGAIGTSRETPARYRWLILFIALFLIAAGVVVLVTRARGSGNWPWGVIAVCCILSGCFVLWKCIVPGSRRRSLGKDAEHA